MQKLEGKTFNVVQENIEKLKELFPEVFTEDKVDIDRLRLALGENVEKEKERYEFTWNGKTEAIQLAQKQTTGTLLPCKDESVNWSNTQNLYIEGDNLEVLRVLQNSYRNKVKMIYIDPPYNTGNDFIYEDDYSDNLKNYKIKNNENMKSNPETYGRFHTKWLNMMYPRLKIAKNLLKEDGVIFISISDKEIHNLRKICDEIFGEENFEGHIHWRRRHNQPNDKTKLIGLVAEHIIVYAKNKSELKASGVGKIGLTGEFSNPDNDPRGEWASKPWKVGSDQNGSKYVITTPTGVVYDGEWMGDYGNYKRLLDDNRIYFPKNGDGSPRKKYYKFEREEEGQCANNWWDAKDFGHNQGANNETYELMGVKNIFSNPKPTELIKNLIQISNAKNDDIILDFFAGSGSTAHATLQQNIDDGQSRRFILVQLPELLDDKNKDQKAAYDFLTLLNKPLNMSEIGKERIRRVAEKIKNEIHNNSVVQIDSGFKCFKLDETNLKTWDEESLNLERSLLDFVEPIKEGRSQEDVVYEVLLKYGIDLTVPIKETKIAGKTVFTIGLGYLLVCLERDLTLYEIEEMAKEKPARIVFYDEGFIDDRVRTNAQQILKRYGVEDIRVI
ncbi:site-specific DNA-methyltransferase [Metabacillus iocasae]|uniref:Adenine-specific DNA-methyltransferase n=1 Tax=Priestia iocasae TaxID=2291674 RepID=A0ABS2QXH9_9BACI|nr:site-specific DNA-methyltransferase [Metabacillus iocasae]MBM7704181.1 adenine-specific DNA-methyltransferase [Metabacillus iocasae]